MYNTDMEDGNLHTLAKVCVDRLLLYCTYMRLLCKLCIDIQGKFCLLVQIT